MKFGIRQSDRTTPRVAQSLTREMKAHPCDSLRSSGPFKISQKGGASEALMGQGDLVGGEASGGGTTPAGASLDLPSGLDQTFQAEEQGARQQG